MRHDRGLEEIQDFKDKLRDSSACRRQLLAPAIGVDSELELTCVEAFEKGVFLMPCNACRRHPTMQKLGLTQEGPLISKVEVVKLLRDKLEMNPAGAQEQFIQPKPGSYSPCDEVELLLPVEISGEITLIESDMSERKASISADGEKMTLAELPDEPWLVSRGKFYSNKRGRKFKAVEDD